MKRTLDSSKKFRNVLIVLLFAMTGLFSMQYPWGSRQLGQLVILLLLDGLAIWSIVQGRIRLSHYVVNLLQICSMLYPALWIAMPNASETMLWVWLVVWGIAVLLALPEILLSQKTRPAVR